MLHQGQVGVRAFELSVLPSSLRNWTARTVAKHLAVEGATFSALFDGLRRELPSRYLDKGSQPQTDISALRSTHFGGPKRITLAVTGLEANQP